MAESPEQRLRAADALLAESTDDVTVAWALNERAAALVSLKDREGALAAFSDLLERFGNDPRQEIVTQVRWALDHSAVIFTGFDQRADALVRQPLSPSRWSSN
jgi:hypothetical protein